MPPVNALTEAGNINPVHMCVVLIATLAFGLITLPYGLVLLMAHVQLVRSMPFSHYNRVHDLFPVSCAVAAEARSAGFGRLFSDSGRCSLYLPAVARPRSEPNIRRQRRLRRR